MTKDIGVTEDKLHIGRVSAAYGLKGWVRIYSYSDPVEQILNYSPWYLGKGYLGKGYLGKGYLGKGGQDSLIEVEKGKLHGKGVIVLFAGMNDRNDAEAMIGYDIWIDRTNLPVLESGDFYWHQLEGMHVINGADQLLGCVDHLMETGANDVLVVKPTGDSVDKRERLVPFVEGEFVKEVNLGSGVIRVAWDLDY